MLQHQLLSNAARLLVFALVFQVAWLTPMHSDDYAYAILGADLQQHWLLYISWSGRVVADMIAGLVLTAKHPALKALLDAAAVTALIDLVARLPRFAMPSSRHVPGATLLLFLLYWLANPALGQTTFWVVGAANYTWTNLFIVLFFAVLLALVRKRESHAAWVPLLFVLGLLAGCSSENTAVVTVALTLFVAVREGYKQRQLDGRFVAAVIGASLGAAILLFSPGNLDRLALTAQSWRELSLLARIRIHFLERLPGGLLGYWPVFAALALVTALSWKKADPELRTYSIAFFIASLLANVVLLGAPAIPPRAYNGGLVFLLISLSFALANLATTIDDAKLRRLPQLILWSTALPGFVLSYALVTRAYRAVYQQSLVRNQLVEAAVKSGQKMVAIPAFHFPRLLKAGDALDPFHAVHMARYYGLKEITLLP